MNVKILFKNKTIKEHNNIELISNQSTNLKSDQLLLYTLYDQKGKPSIIYKIEDILCIETTQERNGAHLILQK